jgi:signal transduction histidine kinase
VVQQTVRKLIDFGHYFRVQICLISASRDRIQAVAGQCENPMLDFTFQTDFPLDPTTPEADWDVQQWVAIKGQAVAIDDASSPFQRSPRTNTEQAAKIQMKGIGVVPLIIKRSGCRPHEILGTIHFERHDRERPTRLEMRYFGILAGQIAVAFDQACRETMLEEALNALPSPFRIVSMDNRVMFRNRAAQTEDHSDQHWSFPIATPPGVVPPGPRFRRSVIDDARSREGDVNHYLTDGGTARDEFAAPIKDWRQNPIGDYYRADPQIGFVHHSFDMTKFQEIHDASQQWLTIRETRETVTRILDYFRTQGFDWCRIYLMEGGVLRSHDEFGLRNKTVRSKFRNGSYSIGLDDHTQQAVCLFEQLKDLAVCEFKPDLEDPPTISRPHGIPTIATRDNWRDHFEKEDDRWLEAPLIVGDAKVGLIAFSIPSSFGPRQYMWLRWCVMNAAIAIQNSQAAERRAKLLEEAAWKAAAQLAIHQLSNKLCNIGPDCTYVQRWLNRPDQITRSGYSLAHDALERTKSAVRKAREILQDFRRYADVKPFRDLRVVTLAELLKTVENNILQYYPELEIEIECSPLQLDIVCSPAAVVEVIEILVENSLLHSHRPRDGLKIEVACCEFDVDANAPEVCIAYSDNGDGIRDQDRPKIFDAFYTTHENGNGLGLPIALTFMQRQGGGIAEIPTPEGQGVLFHLYLPRATTTNIRM